jgi:NAD(P)-dependent dehydrogenase (short-subunit alcohol dehydrogenase family)
MSQQHKFNKLEGARVLVLGGTSGIGFAVAQGSLEYGASVVISSSNPEKVERAVSRLREGYPEFSSRVSGQACDLYNIPTMEASINSLFTFATKDGKKIDHLVNTAGSPGYAPSLSEITPEQIGTSDRLAGIMMLAKHAPKYMETGPQTSITLTTGTMLFKPVKDFVTAIPWAGAVDAASRALAISLAPLRVNAVAPGAIDTELLQSMGNGNEEIKEATYKLFRDTNLLGTLGRPEDTAEAYLYLMKDRFVTGQTILSDGGRLLK